MDAQDNYTIETTVERTKELAQRRPSWEGGFAVQVAESINILQQENRRLTRLAGNLQCELDDDEDYTFCDCGKEPEPYEVTRPCSVCGGIVPGAVMLKEAE